MAFRPVSLRPVSPAMHGCVVVTALIAAGLAAVGSAAAPGGSNPLASSAAFRKNVSLTIKETPLGAVCDQLRATEGLPVRADATTQDERVNLACRNRPASEALDALARHFDYTWRPNPKAPGGFLLVQTPEQRAREVDERDRLIAADRKVLEAEAQELARQGRMTEKERMERRVERIRERNGGLNPANVVEAEITRLRNGERGGASYEDDALCAGLSAISAADWEKMWQGVPFRFAYPATPGRQTLTHSQALDMVRLHMSQWTKAPRQRLGSLYGVDCDVTALRGEIVPRVRTGRMTVYLRCRYAGRRPEEPVVDFLEASLYSTRLQPYPHPDPADVDLADPGAFAGPRPAVGPPIGGNLPVGDLLGQLADRLPYVVVSDCYEPQWEFYGFKEPAPSFREWLVLAAQYLGRRVRQEGGMLSFRSKTWAISRALQVPDRLYDRWREESLTKHALSLKSLTELAAVLSDGQMDQLAGRYRRDVKMGVDARFYLNTALSESLDAIRLLGLLKAYEPAGMAALAGKPRVIQPPGGTQILSRLLTDFQGKSLTYDILRKADLARPPELYLDDEMRLEGGRPLALRLWRYPIDFDWYPTGFESWALDRAGKPPHPPVRQKAPGTCWILEIYPDPAGQQFLFYSFYTSDPPPPAEKG